jgi:M penetrans paralogue family 26
METTQNEIGILKPVPNSTAVLVLGIVSIVLCCCYGLGLIGGIIALVLHKKALKTYNGNPAEYTSGSLKNLNAGRVCAIIGIILSALFIIYLIWIIRNIGIEALSDQHLLEERLRELFGK